MLQMQTLTTDGLPAHKRVEFWNDVACQTLTAQCAEPASPEDFSGSMKLAHLNDLRIIELSSEAATVVRTRAHIARSAEPLFVLRMQLSGESVSYQEGREAWLRPGDFTLCDCSRPYRVTFRERAVMLAVRIPRATLLRYVAAPEAMILIPMSGVSGPSAVTSKCMQEFWRTSSQWLTPTLAPRITNIMLELIASAYASLPQAQADQAASKTALRVRIFEYIENHLHDVDLTPTSIAQAFRITPRYLHLLFGSERDTVARFVLRRRLEKCSQALADPKHRTRSISVISSTHGFKSLPHFCRTFREQYGMRPGEFRRVAVESVD
jgi:AraC-like DNA-binding protein